ncbi:hypothetical protein NPIL_292161 [Nephila pilipes]|uniref:Uncharacterized protein n=1 Tax=Nephila pilipes TaxID=299642 RepID=A0A8X6Q9R1_NEPPI|nr:hypothetical protein NPIL_292161 [Nephila pilipes]
MSSFRSRKEKKERKGEQETLTYQASYSSLRLDDVLITCSRSPKLQVMKEIGKSHVSLNGLWKTWSPNELKRSGDIELVVWVNEVVSFQSLL